LEKLCPPTYGAWADGQATKLSLAARWIVATPHYVVHFQRHEGIYDANLILLELS